MFFVPKQQQVTATILYPVYSMYNLHIRTKRDIALYTQCCTPSNCILCSPLFYEECHFREAMKAMAIIAPQFGLVPLKKKGLL